MRITVAAVLLGIMALGTMPAPAEPFTDAFDSLSADLVNRRDNDFLGTLDRAQKKQRKGVLKSLKKLDRPADDLGDDLKTAEKVVGALEKAYPEEFAAGILDPTLGGLTDAALDALEADLFDLRSSILGGLGSLSGKPLAKAQDLLDKADAAWEASLLAPTRSARARALGTVWKYLSGAKRILDRAGVGPGAEGLTASIDGVPYTATELQCSVTLGAQDFLILAGNGSYPAAHSSIFISLDGVDGMGTYGLDGTSTNVQVYAAESTQAEFHTVATGSITITVYDPPSRIAGTFSMITMADPGVLVVTDGEFDIRSPLISVSP